MTADNTKGRAMVNAADELARARDDACEQRIRDLIQKFNRQSYDLPKTAQGATE